MQDSKEGIEVLLAHYNRDSNESQDLLEHSLNVAREAQKQGEQIRQGSVMFLLGLLHDVGKADRKFQKKLLERPNEFVQHAYAGAKYLCDKISGVLDKYVNTKEELFYVGSFLHLTMYVIASHHGVFDIPLSAADDEANSFGHSHLLKRILGNEKGYHYNEDVLPFVVKLEEHIVADGYNTLDLLIKQAYEEYRFAWRKIGEVPDRSERYYYLSMFMRLYLSMLKNADILDTVNAYQMVITPLEVDRRKELIASYYDAIERKYQLYGKAEGRLNLVRQKLAEAIRRRGDKDSAGIYRLELPTGAGKTSLSLRYAFHQMKHCDKQSLIYAAPYLSILEQNATEIKRVIGEEGVLEHHSNVILDDSNDEYIDIEKRKIIDYLIDSWDSPVTLTTMVQFFQTLFKTRASNIRRFSSLVKSVIVLDEVQALPLEVTTLFNLTMNFVKLVMGATVILCTATQPLYDVERIPHRLRYGDMNGEEANLVELSEADRQAFERTDVRKFREDNEEVSLEDISNSILKQKVSTLIILNTKKSVERLYSLILGKTQRTCYYLSTNMCAAHRFNRIQHIRQDLEAGIPIICVSTQLIEAGVDVDFQRVIRSYAGIDSIVQASGRCNREGRRPKGDVTLVKLSPEVENVSTLKVIKEKQRVTERILRNANGTILLNELNDEFYERYYDLDESNLKFDYPLNGRTAYQYLSDNHGLGFEGCIKTFLKQSFKKAGESIDLIKDETDSVIVPYDEHSRVLIEEMENILSEQVYRDIDWARVRSLNKQLQRYTVNIPKNDELISMSKSYIDGRLHILSEEYYDQDKGVVNVASSFLY